MRIYRRIGPLPRLALAGIFAVAVVLLFTAAVKKGVRGKSGGGGMDAAASDYLDAGNYWMKIWNQLYIGDQNGDMAGEWPGGSGVNYMYIGNLWFGALKGTNIHVSGDFPYLTNEWHPIAPTESELLASDKSNWDLRPSKVKTVGDLDTYAICDDSDATENGPIPITAEMHGISWSAPGHDDWIVLECWITNDYTGTLNDCYVSLAYDEDIGGSLDYVDDLAGYDGNDSYDLLTNPTVPGMPWDPNSGPDGIPDENDYVNFNSSNGYPEGRSRMLDYMYDEGGEGRSTPGYCGIRVMGWMDDNDPEGSLIEISSQHSWDIMNDPDNDAYKYGYMIDTGTYEEITTAYDWRIDPVFGPFDMEANDVVHWWTGNVMGGDLLDLRKNADQLYADFVGPDGIPGSDDDWQVVAPPASPRLVAVRGDNQVTLRWNPNYAPGKNTENDPDPRTGVVDFDGYIVWRSDIGFDSGWEPILWIDKQSTSPRRNFPWGWRVRTGAPRLQEHIPDGTGSFTEPNLTNSAAVTYEGLKNNFPTPTRQGGSARVRKVSGYYEFVDGVDGNGQVNKTLTNGTRYYYSVVGFDFGYYKQGELLKYLPTSGGKNVNGLAVIPLPTAKAALDNVRVVPNPYKGSADWEEWTGSGARLGRIYFMNLPSQCTIRIYTVAGDLVRTLEHNDVTYGAEPWDLTGNAGVQVASGVYIYHIDAPDIGEKIGKFAVLVGQN